MKQETTLLEEDRLGITQTFNDKGERVLLAIDKRNSINRDIIDHMSLTENDLRLILEALGIWEKA